MDTEAVWKQAQRRYITEEKDGKATVVTEDIRIPRLQGTQAVRILAGQLEGANVLTMLVRICEDPGNVKSFYTETSKTAFNAVKALIDLMLVEERREPYARYGSMHPTELGKAVYTGLWYAAHQMPLVPQMQTRDILTPSIFWPTETYRLEPSGYDTKYGFYKLVDVDDPERSMTIHDVFVDPDGGMWFSPSDTECRCKVDIDEELDTLDESTQKCLEAIIRESVLVETERVTKGYEDLMGYTQPPEPDE